ncbi:hypothetical protein TPB0596_04390 [Tsukamurella pulmonis]|nr:hypothetical protein TPB0596_04390 [Tsukamurella pulmonis]
MPLGLGGHDGADGGMTYCARAGNLSVGELTTQCRVQGLRKFADQATRTSRIRYVVCWLGR